MGCPCLQESEGNLVSISAKMGMFRTGEERNQEDRMRNQGQEGGSKDWEEVAGRRGNPEV